MTYDPADRTQPIPDISTEPFWQATAEGRLLVQRSPATGRLQWPPRPRMLPDWREEPEWVEAPRQGHVYTYSVALKSPHKAPAAPYVLAVIELPGEIFLLTNVVGEGALNVKIGMTVEIDFEQGGAGVALPVARLVHPEGLQRVIDGLQESGTTL